MAKATDYCRQIDGVRKVGVHVFALLFFLGCLIPASGFMPSAEAGGDVPTPTGSHYAYWHWDDGGGSMWSNTNADDGDDGGSTTKEITKTTATTVSYEFPVKANMGDDSLLDSSLYFQNNGVVNGKARLDMSVSGGAVLPDEITFFTSEDDGAGNRLNTWSIPVGYRDDGTYQFYIKMDEVTVSSGHILSVGFSFEAQAGTTTVTILTDGESYSVLPLIEGSNGGNGGNGENGGNGDTTDDGDEDDDSTMLYLGIGILLIIIIVVAVALRRR